MISFIIIGKNEGWRLEKCLKSICSFVKAERIDEYEIIYVDSKSSDDSLKISKSYGATTALLTGEVNAAIGRNVGAKIAKGDVYFFLDGDMELIPGFYSSLFDKDGNLLYPFVSGIERDVLHDNDWNYVETKVRRTYVEGKDQFSITTGGLFLISSDLWRSVGGMRDYYKKSQDLDLGIRLSEKGWRLCRKPQIWVNHYTQYYQARKNFSSTLAKYSALLSRQHFFNYSAQIHLFKSNYFSWILLVSILAFFITMNGYVFIPYLGLLFFKSLSSKYRHSLKTSIFRLVYDQVLRDVLFIYHIFTFFPKQPAVSYSLI